jgi:hypothetical protein
MNGLRLKGDVIGLGLNSCHEPQLVTSHQHIDATKRLESGDANIWLLHG